MDIKLELEDLPHEPVKLSRIPFTCTQCGACCRHVENSVFFESLDVFRLAQYFRSVGNPVQGIENILTTYADMAPLAVVGYPMFTLKTTGPDQACIFLRDNRCSIQPAKTRTCRVYPFSALPEGNGRTFVYTRCVQHAHYFTGGEISISKWMHDNYSVQDREYTLAEFEFAPKLGQLLYALRRKAQDRVWEPVIHYKYLNFNLDKPFLPQYARNTMRLMQILKDMAK